MTNTLITKSLRKSLAILLTLIILVGIVPFWAFAEDELVSDENPIDISTASIDDDYMPDEPSNNNSDEIAPHAPDRVLIKMASVGGIQSFSNSILPELPDLGVAFSDSKMINPSANNNAFNTFSIMNNQDQNNVFLLTLEDASENAVEDALEILNAHPLVDIAERDYYYEISTVPNDPRYDSQYALRSLNAVEAWKITTGSKDVVVGIIDTGIEGTHPDLIDNIWVNPNVEHCCNLINDIHGFNFTGFGYASRTGGIPTDIHGHGTHVAGIVGAKGNNGIGITGINWDVSLAWLGVHAGGNLISTSAAIEAVNYAQNHSIPITNNSYGGPAYSEIFEQAIQNYDGLFVVAAGNNSSNNDWFPMYPANYNSDNVISVASSNEFNIDLSSFSNFGVNTVHTVAPGSSIISTYLNGSYTSLSGTSMASPYVAGIAALVIAANPTLNTSDIKDAIIAGAGTRQRPWFSGRVMSGGIVDANASLMHIPVYSHTVTFHYNDGVRESFTNNVHHGNRATVPSQPTRDGYVFIGWFTSIDDGWLFNFDTIIIDDFQLYAKWLSLDGVLNVDNGVNGENFTFSDGIFTITGDVMVAGSTDTNRIVVAENVNASITFVSVNIDRSATLNTPAFLICSGAKVTLTLLDGFSNFLTSGGGRAGLEVPEGAELIINGKGSLTATGGVAPLTDAVNFGGAGIGGGTGSNCGTITIIDGMITAFGGGRSNSSVFFNTNGGGAGIGGGHSGNGGTINILGGVITAVGRFNNAAGIGGGSESSSGNITITGGIITANSSGRGAGIGSGGSASRIVTSSNSNGIICIGGDAIVSSSSNSGAGIGSGMWGSHDSLTIMISDDATVTAVNSFSSNGIGNALNCDENIVISINDNSKVTADGGASGGGGSGIGSCEVIINGGVILTTGGIAGINGGNSNQVINNSSITINGGFITATGGTSGIGDNNRQAVNNSSITINGGFITTTGGVLGIGFNRANSDCIIKINGGVINASGDRIGIGYLNGTENSIIIDGGNIKAIATSEYSSAPDDIFGTIKNSFGEDLYLNTLSIEGVNHNTQVNNVLYGGITNPDISYGTNDVTTDENGFLYFYLPATTIIERVQTEVDNIIYYADYSRNTRHGNVAKLGTFGGSIPPSWNDVQDIVDNISTNGTIDISQYGYPRAHYTINVGDNKTFTLKGNNTEIQNVSFIFGSNNNITIENINIRTARRHNDTGITNGQGYSPLHFTGLDNTLILSATNIISSADQQLLTGYGAAVGVVQGASLLVTSDNNGTLTANGSSNGAGIGSGRYFAHGDIRINGNAIVNASSTWSSGIGSGPITSSININGIIEISDNPQITATSLYSAGIGGGSPGSSGGIEISGGNITAASATGSGIGAGQMANSPPILITGGAITAIAGQSDLLALANTSGRRTNSVAGIGGGEHGVNNITISGGDITAISIWGPGIGGNNYVTSASFGNISISGDSNIVATGSYAGIGGGINQPNLWVSQNLRITIGGNAKVNSIGGQGAGIGASHQQVNSPGLMAITINDNAIVNATSNGEGSGLAGTEIIINGGTTTATGSLMGAGIGGSGRVPHGVNVTINGGTVIAKGGANGAGIGGSNNGNGGSTTITGGTINATGGTNGAGIGGGSGGNGGNVIITGGSIRAISNGETSETIGFGNGGSSSGTLRNGVGTNIFLNSLDLSGITQATAINVVRYNSINYGTNDVKTDLSGKLYFYLPESSKDEWVEVDVNNSIYASSFTRFANHDNSHELTLKQSLTNAVITIETGPFIFTGSAIKPSVTSVTVDGILLNTSDYNVSYSNNINVGTATIIVTAIANYSGSASTTFSIDKALLTDAIITFRPGPFTYAVNRITPAIESITVNGNTLNSSDYTVSYSNNINVGTAIATITATASGNYSGTTTASFNITKAIAQEIITNISDVTRSALSFRNQNNAHEVVNSSGLPTSVQVRLCNGNTATLHSVSWTAGGDLYNPKGATYTATSILTGTDNVDVGTVSKTVNITKTLTIVTRPTFEDKTFDVQENGGFFNASQLGLPRIDWITVEGHSLRSTIDWGMQTLDVTKSGNYTIFNGTITYDFDRCLTVVPSTSVTCKVTVVGKTPVTINATVNSTIFTGSQWAGISNLTATQSFPVDLLLYTYVGINGTQYGPTTTRPTNTGDYSVTISVPTSNTEYQGSNTFFFTILPTKVTEIITSTPHISRSAFEFRHTSNIQDIIGFVNLPQSVQVRLCNGNTTSLPISWTTSGAYNPRSAVYTATSVLDSNSSNICVEDANNADGSIIKTVSITKTAVNATNPTFTNATVFLDENGGFMNASQLGASVLPTSGSVNIEGENITYTINWGSQTLDTSAVGASTTFNGTITYDSSVIWLTVPSSLVIRTVSVVDIIPITINATASNTTYTAQQWNGLSGVGVVGNIFPVNELVYTYVGTNNTQYGPTATRPINAGSYSVTISVPAENTEYQGSNTFNFTINPAPLTIRADNKSVPITSARPALTFTVAGLVGGQSVAAALTSNPTLNTNAYMNMFGNYTITISGGAANANYTITNRINGTLTVTATQIEQFVVRLYSQVLGRTPDAYGLNSWTNALSSRRNTGTSVAHGFFFSTEFLGRNLTNEEFIDTMYSVLLNRRPDAVGRAHWLAQLNSWVPREVIFEGFANSPEFNSICAQYGITAGSYTAPTNANTFYRATRADIEPFVTRLYSETLGRNPDNYGLEAWIERLGNGMSGTTVAHGFVFSVEMNNKNLSDEAFVEALYRTLLGRTYDDYGRSAWVSRIKNGMTREEVFYGFAVSPEFAGICIKHWIRR
ncbi:MAG: S8 family serine peptidase [Oscillospiraceae bacterium]|jgi:uncharacterized repeat protein (TIGR02543 family)|nr:S8 family serine peptidase [Oscillospiraceae bacterium]